MAWQLIVGMGVESCCVDSFRRSVTDVVMTLPHSTLQVSDSAPQESGLEC